LKFALSEEEEVEEYFFCYDTECAPSRLHRPSTSVSEHAEPLR